MVIFMLKADLSVAEALQVKWLSHFAAGTATPINELPGATCYA
jgi:hypothetical protein